MKVVGVVALVALLALCDGLSMTKEGPLKKHSPKKDGLVSSAARIKVDKKDASVIRLTGQTLVPKKDDVTVAKTDFVSTQDDVMDAKTDFVNTQDDVPETTKSTMSKDEEVSVRVRQQIRDSEGLEGGAAEKKNIDGEHGPDLNAFEDPESKLLQIGGAQIELGGGTGGAINNIGDTTFGVLGSLFNVGGVFDGTNLFSNFPSIQVGGTGAGGTGLLSGLTTVGLGSTMFGGVVGIGAALAAGLAAILAFIVPGLQIANQILAIIAISMLGAYLAEDKEGDDYYDTGYDSGTGYDDSGTGYSLSGSGGGYGSSPGVLGSGTGYSSYSDYRRSALGISPFDGYTNLFGQQQALAANSIDGSGVDSFYAGVPILSPAGKPVVTGRSGTPMVSPGLVSRVGRMVSDAVEKYSSLYDKENKE